MKKILFTLLIFALTVTVFAHEFWLQPHKFIFNKGETAIIRFNVGENFKGENWSGNKSRIQRLIHYLPSGKHSDISGLLSDNAGDSLQLPIVEEGTHMVVFNSVNSFINIEAAKFNEYLKEDGLISAATYRKQHSEEQLNGKEYYQRSVKTLMQAGKLKTDEMLYKTDLPLDIVPSKNIYSLRAKARIGFTVYFKQQPLTDTKVVVWHIQKYPLQGLTTKEFITNHKGQVTTEISPAGDWMISCVHMERNKIDTIADWQSYWGSVTFGY
ncbi:MAG: DUF4198 domain-containing protein [Ginsengibacter sp.]